MTTTLVAGGAMMMMMMMIGMMICRVSPFTFHGGSGVAIVAAIIDIDIGYLLGAGGLFASVGQREQSSVESCDHYLSISVARGG